MAKIKGRTRNTTKIEDLKQDLRLNDGEFNKILREVNIRVDAGQRNLDQNEVGRIRRYLKEKQRRAELKAKTIELPPIVKVQDFATALQIPVGEIMQVLLKNGVMATLNDDIDYDTAAIIAEDLGYQTNESVAKLEEDAMTPEKLEEILKKDPDAKTERPPVVTIMGHVDHGKTTLLDTIRSAQVAKGEAGGITQAISSYQAKHKDRLVTFIDTPGHATFEFMRQRGASLADIAVLVVAADDGVKPQTKEAVKHAKEAGVPIVVAINKVDKAEANVEKVKKELSEQLDLLPEEWGGKTVMVPVSALKGDGIEELLEMILLANDVEPPQANPERSALASVIESGLDKSLGSLATILVHTGTLKVGDDVVVGGSTGRVRKLQDWKGHSLKEAGPSTPVTVIGLSSVPEAGEILQVVDAKDEASRKASSQHRAPAKTISQQDENDTRKTLALVLKADSHGSIEALKQTIEAMVPDSVRLSIIRSEVGTVSDSDVLTAQAAGAIIYAFNTNVSGMSKKLADKEDVPVKTYKVIYELTDDVRQEIEERLPFEIVREDLGTLKVLKVFFSTQKKKIIGGEVAQGKLMNNAKAIVWRKAGKEKEQIGEGEITGLQSQKQEIKEAQTGDQVGLTFEGKGKIKEGDILEIYKEEKIKESIDKS